MNIGPEDNVEQESIDVYNCSAPEMIRAVNRPDLFEEQCNSFDSLQDAFTARGWNKGSSSLLTFYNI